MAGDQAATCLFVENKLLILNNVSVRLVVFSACLMAQQAGLVGVLIWESIFEFWCVLKIVVTG